MTRHLSAEQLEHWLDDAVVQEITRHAEEDAEFNYQVTLSRLPIHLIKEETWGPVRVVGRNEFDTDRSKALLRDESLRGELLEYVGPMLAATPGFYTFLDDEGTACRFRDAETLQVEYRIYPDEASQQALMDGVMAIATSMRYVQNVVSAIASVDEGA